MKIQDHIYYRNGQWVAEFEYRTRKSPERNYGTGTTKYLTLHKHGLEAFLTLRAYCNTEGIECNDITPEWEEYYKRADSFYERMEAKKPDPSDSKAMSEWDMAHSCDAPNKPGYYRANND